MTALVLAIITGNLPLLFLPQLTIAGALCATFWLSAEAVAQCY
ncbi:hypothetical protein [Sodalis-like endosymbiont of Proechinophthirus fluctus]|nr:hypothetical protein [Sodalis-like endosymbiont of Proechinophthirus fluctus]